MVDIISHGIFAIMAHLLINGLNCLLKILYLYKGKNVIIKYQSIIDRHDLWEAHGISLLIFSEINNNFNDCFIINPLTSIFYGLEYFKGKCKGRTDGISVEIEEKDRKHLKEYKMMSYLFINENCPQKGLLIINIVSLKSLRNSLWLLMRWYFGKKAL